MCCRGVLVVGVVVVGCVVVVVVVVAGLARAVVDVVDVCVVVAF